MVPGTSEREPRPSAKKSLWVSGRTFGCTCMSMRQPLITARAAISNPTVRTRLNVAIALMRHLRDRARVQARQERMGCFAVEPGIDSLDAEEKLVEAGSADTRNIKA